MKAYYLIAASSLTAAAALAPATSTDPAALFQQRASLDGTQAVVCADWTDDAAIAALATQSLGARNPDGTAPAAVYTLLAGSGWSTGGE